MLHCNNLQLFQNNKGEIINFVPGFRRLLAEFELKYFGFFRFMK